MKTKISLLLLLALSVTVRAQTPAPVVLPPLVTQTQIKPVTVELSASQFAYLMGALISTGTAPSGVSFVTLSTVTTGTNTGGSIAKIHFFPH